ncbi:MAG TPA: glycosyltransferase [Planctomycetota bacterium]|nr:glycosyltransferase [Planctomycetota bacterium]
MKVAHLVHQYPPEFRGGTEACVETLAAAQRARGDAVLVVAGSDRRDPRGAVRRETVGGTAVARVLRRPGENYSMDWRQPRVAEQVVGVVREFAPDVVHLHHALNLSGDLAARLAAGGLPVVATLHDFTLVCARFFLVRPDGESCEHAFPLPSERCVACVLPDFAAGEAALRVETAARKATAAAEAAALRLAIAPSEAVHVRWARSGLFGADKLVTLAHPAPEPAAPPAPPRPRADGRLVVATWGHLAPAKGVLDLLAALCLARDPRLALIVLGEPVDADHAEELLDAAEGLDVVFRGRYEAADLPALRGEADLAVFPSRAEETFGLVVAEARALGFPVVVSDRGALPERVGAAGAVLPAADPSALAHLLAALLRDPAPLAAWSAAPRDDLLTPAAHAARVADLYDRARTP